MGGRDGRGSQPAPAHSTRRHAGLPPHWGGRSHLQALALAVLSAGPFWILTGSAAALPPPGSLRSLPGQGCSILRRDSPSDDQVALTQPDHIAVLLGDRGEGSELSGGFWTPRSITANSWRRPATGLCPGEWAGGQGGPQTRAQETPGGSEGEAG